MIELKQISISTSNQLLFNALIQLLRQFNIFSEREKTKSTTGHYISDKNFNKHRTT
jgi:hypothetical protein